MVSLPSLVRSNPFDMHAWIICECTWVCTHAKAGHEYACIVHAHELACAGEMCACTSLSSAKNHSDLHQHAFVCSLPAELPRVFFVFWLNVKGCQHWRCSFYLSAVTAGRGFLHLRTARLVLVFLLHVVSLMKSINTHCAIWDFGSKFSCVCVWIVLVCGDITQSQ